MLELFLTVSTRFCKASAAKVLCDTLHGLHGKAPPIWVSKFQDTQKEQTEFGFLPPAFVLQFVVKCRAASAEESANLVGRILKSGFEQDHSIQFQLRTPSVSIAILRMLLFAPRERPFTENDTSDDSDDTCDDGTAAGTSQ